MRRHDEVYEAEIPLKKQKESIFESFLKQQMALGRQIKIDKFSIRNLSVAANQTMEVGTYYSYCSRSNSVPR